MDSKMFINGQTVSDNSKESALRLFGLDNTDDKPRNLQREYSLNLERMDSLQWLLQSTVKEKSCIEKELRLLKEACSEREISFQETIRAYCSVVAVEKAALQQELDDVKQRAALEQARHQEQNELVCDILKHILRSDSTPYLAFQQAYKQSGKAKKGLVLLKRLQQLCHKISIQQLTSEHKSSGVLRRKKTSDSRSRSRGRISKTSSR